MACVPSMAARNLSSVTWLMMRNQPALPGGTASPICCRTSLSMPVLPSLPKSAPMPAPIAMPRNGMKKSRPKSMPQKAPPMAPAPTRPWPCLTCGLPSGSRTTSAASLQLDDHVLLQLRELEAEAVGLHLVLEAEDHHLAHRLSCSLLSLRPERPSLPKTSLPCGQDVYCWRSGGESRRGQMCHETTVEGSVTADNRRERILLTRRTPLRRAGLPQRRRARHRGRGRRHPPPHLLLLVVQGRAAGRGAGAHAEPRPARGSQRRRPRAARGHRPGLPAEQSPVPPDHHAGIRGRHVRLGVAGRLSRCRGHARGARSQGEAAGRG